MSLQEDYNLAVSYIARYGCSSWGDNPKNDCSGWILTDFDTYHKCPIHFDGQMSPFEYEGIYDVVGAFVRENYADNDQEFKNAASLALIDYLTKEAEFRSRQSYREKVQNNEFFQKDDIPF